MSAAPQLHVDLHTYAEELRQLGFTALPLHADGSKRPLVHAWTHLQHDLISAGHLQQIWRDVDTDGIGVLCGAASGGLQMVECEGRALHLATQLSELMADNGLAKVWHRVSTGWVEGTPSGGIHWHYRCAEAGGNTKIARRPSPDGKGVEVLLETRGQGGFTVAAPSAGRTHPTGRGWTRFAGGPHTCPTLTLAEHEKLLAVASMLDEMPAAPPPAPKPQTRPPDGTLRPGDDYTARTSWAEILTPHGWQLVRSTGEGRATWTRPGKNTGVSATTREDAGLYVFSTSTGFDTEVPYSKFGAYALLEHGGDMSAAARALRAAGFGEQQANLTQLLTRKDTPCTPKTGSATAQDAGLAPGTSRDAHAISTGTNSQRDASTQDPHEMVRGNEQQSTGERSSWWPIPLDGWMTGEVEEERPAFLERSDGAAAWYPGRVNGIIGPSESGKTWVALEAVRQAVDAGRRVTILDFEDSPRGLAGRLRALAVEVGAARDLVRYINPSDTLNAAGKVDLSEHLTDWSPELVIIDGVNAAMQLMGYKVSDNDDATKFAQQLLLPIAATGACVAYVDHVPKSKDDESRGAIGAQAKRAMTSGCALRVEVTKEFGKGQDGILQLRVDKDRPGTVRGSSLPNGRGAWWATADIHSFEAGIDISVNSPSDKAGDFRPTLLMSKVSDFLAARGAPVSMTAIEEGVPGRARFVREAVRLLVKEGHVSTSEGPRRATLHTLERPFTGDSVPLRPTPSHSVPDGVPNPSSATPSHSVPTPYEVGVGGDGVGGQGGAPAEGQKNPPLRPGRCHPIEGGASHTDTSTGEVHPATECPHA